VTATSRVVVVGAGVTGASVAWHLLQAGVRDVVVIDRATRVGLGSTAAATGGFRAQFSSAINVRLSLFARGKLLRFREEVGGDPGYVPAGYLWLASSTAALDALRAARRTQEACGLPEAVDLDVEDVPRLQPAASLAGIVGGAYCPTDGYITPMGLLSGYLEAAVRGGARVVWESAPFRLDRDADGRVRSVATREGSIGCDAVVVAAGAWSAGVCRLAGAAIPITPLRRQVAMTAPSTLLAPGSPMTIWCEDGFHVRPRDGRILLAFPSPGDASDPWSVAVEPSWLGEVASRKNARLPRLAPVPIDPAACWAGLYEMTPDRHAILGALPGSPNVVVAGGSSGHGVMHAPALGQLLAEIMTDGAATTLDATSLRPSRFAEGATHPVSDLL
jgi:sarcosine oxidase subunit beta